MTDENAAGGAEGFGDEPTEALVMPVAAPGGPGDGGGRGRVSVPKWAVVAGSALLVVALCAFGVVALNGGGDGDNDNPSSAAADTGSESTTTNAATSTTGASPQGGATGSSGTTPNGTPGSTSATNATTTTAANATTTATTNAVTTTTALQLFGGTTAPRPPVVAPTCPPNSHRLLVPFGQECLSDQPDSSGHLMQVPGVCPPDYHLEGSGTGEECDYP